MLRATRVRDYRSRPPPDGGPWTDTTLEWQSGLNTTPSWPAAQDDVGVAGYRVVVTTTLSLKPTKPMPWSVYWPANVFGPHRCERCSR